MTMSGKADQLEIEVAKLRRTLEIMASRPGPCPCVKCGHEVEPSRRVYVLPTCYACLPPPEPLPIAPLKGESDNV